MGTEALATSPARTYKTVKDKWMKSHKCGMLYSAVHYLPSSVLRLEGEMNDAFPCHIWRETIR